MAGIFYIILRRKGFSFQILPPTNIYMDLAVFQKDDTTTDLKKHVSLKYLDAELKSS